MTARVGTTLGAVVLLVAACSGAPAETAEDDVAPPSATAESTLRAPEGDTAPGTMPGSDADTDAGMDADTDAGIDAAADDDAAPAADATDTGPSTEAAPAPSADVEQAPREATSADAAAYLRDVQPEDVHDLDGVAVDLDGDGTHEVVLSGVREGRGWLALAAWEGHAYRIVAEGRGGPGDRVEQVSVADVNGDRMREAVLEVSGDGAGSLALWRVPPRIALVPLRADGGCHDGSHVYGAVGAHLVPGPSGGVLDVVATCDDTPLPRADWSTQRWAWDGVAYVHVPEGPGPDPAPGRPSGPASDGPDAEGD